MELPTSASSTQNTTKKPRELRLCVPTAFTGDTYRYDEFKQSVQFYLAMNKEIYNTDLEKIAFTLNYLRGGTAALWKTEWIRKHLPTENWGTYTEFITELDKIFLTQDEDDRMEQIQDALNDIKQNGRRAAEFVVDFRIHAYRANMTSPEPESRVLIERHLRNTFKRALDDSLLKRVVKYDSGNGLAQPLEWWYKRVVWLDEYVRRSSLDQNNEDDDDGYMRSDLGEDMVSDGGGSREMRFSCFRCRKEGHLARDCRSNNTNIVKPRNPRYKGKNYDPNYQPPSSRKSKAVGKNPEVLMLTDGTEQP